MIYINGDSHSAGADIIPGICFAEDDPRFLAYGRRAHPEAIVQTYGYHIAQAFNQGFFCEAESGSSNDRILRTTKHYIENTKNIKSIGYIVIGWTSYEREEWKYGDDYFQISASGTDSVPENMADEYKAWVIKQTSEEVKRKEKLWHDRIWDFHCELKEQNVNHLFFNTMQPFTNDDKDWDSQFIPVTYNKWLMDQGFDTVENSNHYGADAHRTWGKYLISIVNSTYADNNKKQEQLQLTQPNKRSIVSKVNKEFKGLQR